VLARPERFELPTPRFVVCCSNSNQKLVMCGRCSKLPASVAPPVKQKGFEPYPRPWWS
jgi:hypothetical protein